MAGRFYVYILFRENGVPFYVGKGTGKRVNRHVSEALSGRCFNPHKNNIIRKMVAKGLDLPRVTIRSGLSEEEAFEIERAFITALGRGPNGLLVNMTDGGDGASGAVRSVETRKRMSVALSGKKNSLGHRHTPEARAKMRAANLGKPKSAEHRAKLRQAFSLRDLSVYAKTPEHREKIGAALRGKPKPWLLGRRHSEETKAKMRAAALLREERKRCRG